MTEHRSRYGLRLLDEAHARASRPSGLSEELPTRVHELQRAGRLGRQAERTAHAWRLAFARLL